MQLHSSQHWLNQIQPNPDKSTKFKLTNKIQSIEPTVTQSTNLVQTNKFNLSNLMNPTQPNSFHTTQDI